MTDTNKPKTPTGQSFKEQILAELEEANRLRKLREEELYQKKLEAEAAAKRTAELLAEYEEQRRLEEQRVTEERVKLERQVQSALDDIRVEKLAVNTKELNEQAAYVTRPQEPSLEAEEVESLNLSPQEETVELVQTQNLSDLVGLADLPEEELAESQVESGLEMVPEEEDLVDTQVPFASDSVLEEEDRPAYSNKKEKTDSIAKKISTILISIIVILMLVTAFFGYRYVKGALNPVDSTSTEYVQVEIPAGSGNKLIGQILEQAGVIKNGTIFNYYTKFRNYTNFQSGYYNFQKNMSLDDIAAELQKGGTAEPTRPALGKVLVTEGYTIDQISQAVTSNANTKDTSDKTPFSRDEFLKLVANQTFINKMVQKYPNLLSGLPSANDAVYQLEGYLFPATYNYYEETTLEELVEEMIATMDAQLAPYYNQIAASGKTVNEVLTLASLVEKEGSTDDDRKMIASVFNNRLQQNMPLQSNIAILYAMGKLGQKTTLAEDAAINTEINSPYNIYRNTGLMPGPVDSPSLSAIKATVAPANTNFLYFVADVKTGNVYYATSYEEHSANVEKYVNSQLN
ncbi:endolytic transglycosylase MltG [Streptococcus cuniculipharyngis]|uniref:Endolytic murein transglycosylase n=1 Tax=Streptococcus cuniculipharyngis TaxID=1562651 RepID=A0A5C5SC66_9STRE|nr:endolytic transglycosylase MltG [Streptococcus cuniculipharyngis]TWS98149.1 endolytic transglycosylase MltG [Streptococcus cuniculipharyngis]